MSNNFNDYTNKRLSLTELKAINSSGDARNILSMMIGILNSQGVHNPVLSANIAEVAMIEKDLKTQEEQLKNNRSTEDSKTIEEEEKKKLSSAIDDLPQSIKQKQMILMELIKRSVNAGLLIISSKSISQYIDDTNQSVIDARTDHFNGASSSIMNAMRDLFMELRRGGLAAESFEEEVEDKDSIANSKTKNIGYAFAVPKNMSGIDIITTSPLHLLELADAARTMDKKDLSVACITLSNSHQKEENNRLFSSIIISQFAQSLGLGRESKVAQLARSNVALRDHETQII